MGLAGAVTAGENCLMNDLLPLFGDDETPKPTNVEEPRITDSQRHVLRNLFGELGVTSAREQFDVVEEITGQRISSVSDLLASNAQILIYQLPARTRSKRRVVTGNDWADREKDTWIDNL